MQLKKGQNIELAIKAIAFGGRGIGEFEGRKVFVNKVMPGDRVMASLKKIKPKYAEAEFVELLEPSRDRVKAKCAHFGVCGGCQFQEMPYEMQLKMKRQHVIDAFERIGGMKGVEVAEVMGCKDPYFYRNKMEFSFGYDGEMNFALGLHLPGRRYDILDIQECHLESAFAVEILKLVREFCLQRKWEPRKFTTDEGFLKSLFIREGKRTGEVMINLVTSEGVPQDFNAELEELVKLLLELDSGEKKITSIYWSTVISKRGQRKRIEEKLLHGKRFLRERMELENGDSLEFDILPQAFFQVNTFQAEILYSQVLKMALNKPQKLVFDLFCGTGTIGLFLAGHVENVLGIELNEDAVKAAKANATRNGVKNIDFYAGSVASMLKELEESPSLIVIDPPRAGLETEKVVEKINEFNCDQIVYVSCNPATLARDCAWLEEYGYRVRAVQPVDMFPHTYHIENVCLLERERL